MLTKPCHGLLYLVLFPCESSDLLPSFADENQCTLFEFADYKGQNSIGYFVQLGRDGTARKLPVDAIVLIVDLFGKVCDKSDTSEKMMKYRAAFDRTRIRDQTKHWTGDQNLIAQAFNVNYSVENPTDPPKRCFLFINKLDILHPMTATVEADAKAAYSDLYERLQRNEADVPVEVMVGSVKDGMGVANLLKNLAREGTALKP